MASLALITEGRWGWVSPPLSLQMFCCQCALCINCIFVPLRALVWLYSPLNDSRFSHHNIITSWISRMSERKILANKSVLFLPSVEECLIQRPELPFYFQLIINRCLPWQVKLFYTQVHSSNNQVRQNNNHWKHSVTEIWVWSVKTWPEPPGCGQMVTLHRSWNVCIFQTGVAYSCKIEPGVKLPGKPSRRQAVICHYLFFKQTMKIP